MNRASITCLLLAVAGISFGVGQSVGQDRAEAGAQAARVQKVKDTEVRFQLHILLGWQKILAERLGWLDKQEHATCLNVRELVPTTATNFPPTCPTTLP